MEQNNSIIAKTEKKAELGPEIKKEILDMIKKEELIYPQLKSKSRSDLKKNIKEIYLEAFKKANNLLSERISKDLEDVKNTVF